MPGITYSIGVANSTGASDRLAVSRGTADGTIQLETTGARLQLPTTSGWGLIQAVLRVLRDQDPAGWQARVTELRKAAADDLREQGAGPTPDDEDLEGVAHAVLVRLAGVQR